MSVLAAEHGLDPQRLCSWRRGLGKAEPTTYQEVIVRPAVRISVADGDASFDVLRTPVRRLVRTDRPVARTQRLRGREENARRRRGNPSQAHSAPDAIRRLGARHGECFPWLIMGEPRMVRCYQTVNRAYEDVSMLLRREPLDLLQRATTTASARARSLATSLRVELAGLEVSVDVRLYVRGIRDGEKMAGVLPALRIELTWEAIHNRALFPSMLAELLVWPPSARETQIEIHGVYWTPMGPIGTALDAAVGHRIAEAAVYRFLSDVVEQLHCELPPLDSPRGKAEHGRPRWPL